MKYLIILYSLSFFAVHAQEPTISVNKNNVRLFYPVHSFFENEYGNVFIANGFGLGVEYCYNFTKPKFGIFASVQANFYDKLSQSVGSVKWNSEEVDKFYLRFRSVGLFSLGLQKELFDVKKVKFSAKLFANYRYGERTIQRNIDFKVIESFKTLHYSDFGIGSNFAFSYQFNEMFSLGLDYGLIGYVYQHQNFDYFSNNSLRNSPLMMYCSIFSGFSF